MMSLSKVIKHENGIDLGSLAPDTEGMQHHWKIDWGAIMAAQVGGIYMRPLMTLTPQLDPHWVGILVLRGRLLLLDTWEDASISQHTQVSWHFIQSQMATKNKCWTVIEFSFQVRTRLANVGVVCSYIWLAWRVRSLTNQNLMTSWISSARLRSSKVQILIQSVYL